MNHYFQFKQFTIYQDACAMKVCTDACLFGAWVAHNLPAGIGTALDIGTGTGLLSLMLAQQHQQVMIDAVELDAAAANQATQNLAESTFSQRVKLIKQDILDFDTGKTYDAIISNPPFYERALKSDQASKNAAKHDTQLTLSSLINMIEALLAGQGNAAILLPYHRMTECESLLQQHGFFIRQKMLMHQSPKHTSPFRVCWIFGKQLQKTKTESIFIRDADQHYTEAFTKLLKAYYLNL